jgi:aspartate/tyrosine/aromatic aminotransferase
MPLLEFLEAPPAEPILKLIAEHRDDPRPEKVDLGVGVYRDASGATPIMQAVKSAEHWLVDTQSSKAYMSCRGDFAFCETIENLVFGDTTGRDDIYTMQTPGGSGALRVAADIVLRAKPGSTVWISNPTWDNHIPLLGGAGLNVKLYPYYDEDRRQLCSDKMIEALGNAQAGDLVLVHACCHNPSGFDLSQEQWRQLVDLIAERKLVPLVDFAYQGFADGLDEDACSIRLLLERVPEMFIAYSCSKNFGLYRDRVGAVSIVSQYGDLAVIDGQAQNIVRTMFSMPPDHGGAVVSHILTDEKLRTMWQCELTGMRDRMKDMRRLLANALEQTAPDYDASPIERANGMFCFLGIPPEQVAQLKSEYGVYMVDSGRINVCGITEDNVQYLAEAIATVWR